MDNKVYVLMLIYYDESEFVRVFTTEQAALDYASKKFAADLADGAYYEVLAEELYA